MSSRLESELYPHPVYSIQVYLPITICNLPIEIL
jgi:hypothetical protein